MWERQGPTVSGNLAVLPFHQVEQRRPFGEVFEVEAQFVVFSQSVEVGEVDLEEVGRVERSEGRHDGIGVSRCTVRAWLETQTVGSLNCSVHIVSPDINNALRAHSKSYYAVGAVSPGPGTRVRDVVSNCPTGLLAIGS